MTVIAVDQTATVRSGRIIFGITLPCIRIMMGHLECFSILRGPCWMKVLSAILFNLHTCGLQRNQLHNVENLRNIGPIHSNPVDQDGIASLSRWRDVPKKSVAGSYGQWSPAPFGGFEPRRGEQRASARQREQEQQRRPLLLQVPVHRLEGHCARRSL